MDRGVDAVSDWLVILDGGRFDGERRSIIGSSDLGEPPAEIRAYDCPCCNRCAVPLPGGTAERALDDVQAPWVPYVRTQVTPSARVAIYVPPDPLAAPAPDLMATLA
jgi:hypothetical protein